ERRRPSSQRVASSSRCRSAPPTGGASSPGSELNEVGHGHTEHLEGPMASLQGAALRAKLRFPGGTSEVEAANIGHRVIGPQEVFADGQAGGVINVEIIGSGDVRMIGEPLMLTEPQDVRDGRKGRPKERGCKMVDKTADKPRSREAEV